MMTEFGNYHRLESCERRARYHVLSAKSSQIVKFGLANQESIGDNHTVVLDSVFMYLLKIANYVKTRGHGQLCLS